MSLRSWFPQWLGASGTVPERDQQTMVVETLLMELDFQIKELESFHFSQDLQGRRLQSGVDYTWLITEPAKPFTVPQLARLELEEYSYKIHPSETGAIISAFRDAVLRQPDIKELPRILRTLVIQTIEKRPKEETLSQWVTKRTTSLTNLRLRATTRVMPINDEDDIERQTVCRVGCQDTDESNKPQASRTAQVMLINNEDMESQTVGGRVTDEPDHLHPPDNTAGFAK